MATYQRVLLALDFHFDNEQIIEKALEMKEANDAELFLVHVNEPLGMAYSADGMTWSEQVAMLEGTIRSESRSRMKELGEKLSVSPDSCFIRDGKAATEIHRLCEEKSVDLVVMGTHGQSGLQLLLGSTANSVLHGSPCDVLSVRVKD